MPIDVSDHAGAISDPPGAGERTRAPMPMIVGVGRSGTTLLRLMLDAHPELALPPETGFIVKAARLTGAGGALREDFFRVVTESSTWPDFHLDRRELEEAVEAIDPFTVADGIRCFYRLYAHRFGKSRVGDKTPVYCLHIGTLARLLPEAHFIHIIRDGRDVAVSVRGLWFSPGSTMEELATDWVTRIEAARVQAPRCPHYLEIRYERLVAEPDVVLDALCAYLGLAPSTEMQRYYLRSAARLQEHEGRYLPDGRTFVSKEQRLSQQRLVRHPPDRSRVGRWRGELTAEEARRFESVAGRLLLTLGYPLSDERPPRTHHQ